MKYDPPDGSGKYIVNFICGRCCFCGAKSRYNHACTGEEAGAKVCPNIDECWEAKKK